MKRGMTIRKTETHGRNESGSYEVMMAFSVVIRSWSGRKALFLANAGIVEL
jgi:hypothetical protein